MKTVITYGTFDILHYGHINLLKRAKALGDYLIVCISTDEFNALKGIKCIQFQNTKERIPSTWAEGHQRDFSLIAANTNAIQDFIVKNKQFPQNFRDFIRKPYKAPEYTADGRKDCFLYF